MKKIILLAILSFAGLMLSCSKDKEPQTSPEVQADYFNRLKEHVVIKNASASLDCQLNSHRETRSNAPEEAIYTLTASSELSAETLITYLYITKTETGYLFEHYTEDDYLLGSIACNNDMIIVDIIPGDPIPETRGFRFWWACTQQQYYKGKEQLQEAGMAWDVLCETLVPCLTANAAMSGLYCMGLK